MMSRPNRSGLLWIALALVATACGGTAGVGDDQTAASTTGPPTTISTTVAPPTPPTTRASTTTSTTTTLPPEPLLLLAFGDSFAARHGWPTQYAALAGEALGREVQVGGAVCSLGCFEMIRVLERSETRALVADADIIVVQPRPGRVFAIPFDSYLDGTCGGEDGQDCIRATLEDFRLYLHDLLDAATATAREEAVIRTAPAGTWGIDHFYPGLRERDPEAFLVFIEAMAEYIRLVEVESAGRCILMTDPSALFNGEDYMQRADSALLRDGAHPSDEGSRVIAEDLHALGYEPTAQSC